MAETNTALLGVRGSVSVLQIRLIYVTLLFVAMVTSLEPTLKLLNPTRFDPLVSMTSC